MNIIEISIDRDDTLGFVIVCKTPLSHCTWSVDSLSEALEKLPSVAEESLSLMVGGLKITVGEGET